MLVGGAVSSPFSRPPRGGQLGIVVFIVFLVIFLAVSCDSGLPRDESASSQEIPVSFVPTGRTLSFPGLLRLEPGTSPDLPEELEFRVAPPGLRFSADGQTLVSRSGENGSRIVSLPANARRLWLSAEGHAALVLDLASALVSAPWEVKLEPVAGPLRLLAELPSGRQPKSVRFSPDGKRLFAALLDDLGVDVYQVGPEGLVFETRLSPPGTRARGYVETWIDEHRGELWVSNMQENLIHAFDLQSLEYLGRVPTGGVMPKVIVQHPDGGMLYVSNWLSKDISVIDPENRILLRRIAVGGTPRGMAFGPDASILYLCIYDAPLVLAIDINTGEILRRILMFDGFGAARHIEYRDGFLYVSDMGQGRVSKIDTDNHEVVDSAIIGPKLNTLVLSPDGRHILVSSRGRNNRRDYTKPGPDFGAVYVLDASNLDVVARVWGRNQPTGLDISPDGRRLAFSDFLDANIEYYAFDPAP